MSRTLAIAMRDLRDRRSIFLTAAVLAGIPFAVLLLPQVASFGNSTVIATAGLFVASCYLFGVATVLGATFVGRELSEKRLSFYFSKPVSSRSLWFGKLAAGLATLAISAAIIAIPMLLAGGEESRKPGDLLAVGLIAVVLFLVSHAISTMLRSRSALIFADLAAGAAAVLILNELWRRLALGLSSTLITGYGWGVLTAMLVILIMAGARQLSRGRIDPRRSHFELSRALWSGVAVLIAVAAAAVLWITSPRPGDLEQIGVSQLPLSNWVVLEGTAKHRAGYRVAFFQNVANGAYERIDAPFLFWRGFFTRDGRVAVHVREGGALELLQYGRKAYDWRSSRHVRNGGAVELIRFGERGTEVTATPLTVPPDVLLLPNDDASRLAILDAGMVSVHDTADGRLLAAARLPATNLRGFFVTTGLLRLYASDGVTEQIFELDVPARRLVKTGTFGAASPFRAAPDGTRALARGPSPTAGFLVLDGRSGAPVGSIEAGKKRFGTILSDGGVVTFDEDGTLSIYGPGLDLRRAVVLPGLHAVWALRELSGRRLLVAGNGGGPFEAQQGRDWIVDTVDLDSGAIVATRRGVRPLQTEVFSPETADPRRIVTPAGAPLVLMDGAHNLIRAVF